MVYPRSAPEMEDREQGYRWEFKEANEYLDKNIRQ
jgi:hypothetical protein